MAGLFGKVKKGEYQRIGTDERRGGILSPMLFNSVIDILKDFNKAEKSVSVRILEIEY